MSNESDFSTTTTELAANTTMSQTEDSTVEMATLTIAPGGVQEIFLQTPVAQGIAGVFAFAAILVTCHHVCKV